MSAPTRRSPGLVRWTLPCLAVAGLCALLSSDVSGQTWRIGVSAQSTARGMAVSEQGFVAVVYSDEDDGGLTLFSPAGKMQSHLALVGLDGDPIRPSDAAFLDETSLIVCGSLSGRPWVARLDPHTGVAVWSRTLTRDPQLGALEHIVINALGHAVLSGYLFDAGSAQTAFDAAVDPVTGAVHYRRLPGGGRPDSLTTAHNGDLLATTSTGGSLVVTRSTSSGLPLWQRRYTSAKSLRRAQIVETSSAELMVVGITETSADVFDLFTLKTDADGTLQWFRSDGGFPATVFGQVQNVSDAVATPDGGLVAAIAQPMPGDGSRDGALLRLDADGDVQWLRAFGQAVHDEVGVAVAITPDGGFYATSYAASGTYFLVRVHSEGTTETCGFPLLSTVSLPTSPPTTSTQAASYTNYVGPWEDVTTLSVKGWPLHGVTCKSHCDIFGLSYGEGTAGSGGLIPNLTTDGGVCLGYTPTIDVDTVLGGAPGLLFLSLGQTDLPGLGGRFLVNPSSMTSLLIQAGGPTGVAGAGSLALPLGTDLTWAQGLTVYLQAAFADPAGPTGKTLSNGVQFVLQ